MKQDSKNTPEGRGIAQQMQLFAEDALPVKEDTQEDRRTEDKILTVLLSIRSRLSSAFPYAMWGETERYARRKAPELNKLLTDAGINDTPVPPGKLLNSTVAERVTADYICVLSGITQINAPEECIEATVNLISDVEAASFDVYGFYFGLYSRYKLIAEVNRQLKSAGDDRRRRMEIFQSVISKGSDYYPVICWMIDRFKIEVADFSFLPPSESIRLIKTADRFTQTYRFVMAYCIAKGIYLLDGEQLSEIKVPEFAKGDRDSMIIRAEKTDAILKQMAEDLAKQMRIAVDAKSTPQEKEKAITAAAQIVRHPKITSEICRKDIYYFRQKPDNDKLMKLDWLLIKPIEDRIKMELEDMRKEDRRRQRNGGHYPTSLTSYNVLTAIEAVSLLCNFRNASPATTPEGLYGYVVKTNLTEFAEACGYSDAGQNEKLIFYHALKVLREITVAVFHTNGKMKPCQILDIPQHPLTTEDGFEIFIYKSFWFMLNGSANIIDWARFRDLKSSERSSMELKFRNTIIDGVTHILEEQLLDDVCGYSYRKRCIEAQYDGDNLTPEMIQERDRDIRKVAKDISDHKGRDRKKLKKLLDKYKDLGLIEYSVSESKEGKKMFIISKLEGFNRTEGLNKPQKKQTGKKSPENDDSKE